MKTIWIPGLLGLCAIQALWAGATLIGLPISFVNLGFVTIPIYWQLIFAMPLIGALGAYLSSRLNGSRLERLAAGLFPSIPMVIAYPLARIANRIFHYTTNTAPPMLTYSTGLLLMVLSIMGLSLGLLVGTLPFLKTQQQNSN